MNSLIIIIITMINNTTNIDTMCTRLPCTTNLAESRKDLALQLCVLVVNQLSEVGNGSCVDHRLGQLGRVLGDVAEGGACVCVYV